MELNGIQLRLQHFQDDVKQRALDKIQEIFNDFVQIHHKSESIKNKHMVIYSILKTEGEIFTELRDFHKAI